MSLTKSQLDADQVLQFAFNDTHGVLQVMNGFLMAKVGRKIAVTYPVNTTEVYTYSDNGTVLFAITVVYTNSTKSDVSTVERTL